jgi:hypothetical protein
MIDILGSNLDRSDSLGGPHAKLNALFFPSRSPGALVAANHPWLDEDAESGIACYTSWRRSTLTASPRGTVRCRYRCP